MFDPAEFIRVARDLSSTTLGEAEHRTALGRVYYGAFLWAREELISRDELARYTDPQYLPRYHSDVRGWLKSKHDRAWQRFRGLYDLRIKADYSIDEQVTVADISQALAYYEYVEEAFRTVLFPAKQDS